MEIWKDIKGYEGLYQISSLKKIKSLERKNKDGKLLREKILKGSKNGNYDTVWLTKDGKGKVFYLDRLYYDNFKQ